jgi:hypothetical protein
MHDGAVVFDTKLNNKQLEKDYAKTIRKIEDMEGEIAIKSARRNALAEQAKEMGVQLDIAKAKLYEMQSAAKGVFSTEEIQLQQENVRVLQAQWNDINNQVESYDRWLRNADDKLDGQRKKAVRLTGELEKASSAGARLADTAESAEVRMTKLADRIGKLATRALVFTVISQGFRLMRDWLGEVIVKDDEATASIARLKGALLTMAQPLLEVVIPVFRVLVDLLTAVIGKIATFLSMLSGKTVQQTAKNAKALNSQASATEALGDAAEKASGQLMGFDEINRLEDTSVSVSAGVTTDTASGEIAPDFSWTEGVSENMEKIAGYVLAIAAGLALWKIGSYFTGPLGAIVTTLGKLVAGVGLVALGITLLVEAFQDASENGWNLQNTLLAVAGIVATGLGLSILTGGWIPLLVAGILSVLLAITTLTGEGGALIDGFKTMFGGFADWIGGAWSGDIERSAKGFQEIWRGAFNVIASILNGLLNLIEMGLNAIQIDVPDWVPFIGGRHFGFNIDVPQIPYLAQGAVIPPNREFLAVLGDQHTGTNIEAPLETIKQALAEVMGQYGGGDININFTGDLAQLARILKPQIDRENVRAGTSLSGESGNIWLL